MSIEQTNGFEPPSKQEMLLLSHATGVSPYRVEQRIIRQSDPKWGEIVAGASTVALAVVDAVLFKDIARTAEVVFFLPGATAVTTIFLDNLRRKTNKMTKALHNLRDGDRVC
jgi:hypothetical protein